MVTARLRAVDLETAADLVEQKIAETLTYHVCLEPALPTDSIRANNSLERVIHDIRRRTRVARASPDGNLAVMARSGCRDTRETTILRAAAALAVVMLFAGPVVARTAPALEWQEGRAPERRYTGEMLKALPAKAVARWLQVESRVDTLIELAVASQIPLVYAAPRGPRAAGCPPGGSVGCGACLLAGTVLFATLGGRCRRALLVGAAAQLVGCLALASRGPEVRPVVPATARARDRLAGRAGGEDAVRGNLVRLGRAGPPRCTTPRRAR